MEFCIYFIQFVLLTSVVTDRKNRIVLYATSDGTNASIMPHIKYSTKPIMKMGLRPYLSASGAMKIKPTIPPTQLSVSASSDR